MLTQKARMTNENSQLVIERDIALNRLEHDQTEKERFQAMISDLEVGGNIPTVPLPLTSRQMRLAKETQARIADQELRDESECLQKEALQESVNAKASSSLFVRDYHFSNSFDRKNYLQRRKRCIIKSVKW